MSESSLKANEISWGTLFPWTTIFKSLSIAATPTIIALALLGALLNPVGWMASRALFFGEDQRNNSQLMETATLNASPYQAVFSDSLKTQGFDILGIKFSGPHLIFNQMVRRFGSMFDPSHRGREFCYFLVGNVWSILVWSFLGLAITRICLIRLTRNEHVGIDEAIVFAQKNWLTAASAMGIPLAGVAVLCLPTAIIGLLMGFDLGVFLVSLIWFVVLLLALLMALLLLGLAVGWPLMVSSVAAESQNAFDAMTRAYAYTFQRPLHYLFYSFVAIFFGGLCWMIVSVITDGVIDLAYWSVSWGTNLYGAERIQMIQGYTSTSPEISETLDRGSNLIGMWNGMVRTLAVAFIYGLFWCQAAAIYLLLRKDVDDTEMDEVFIEQEARTYELPPLKTDEQGIPQVQPLNDE
jgi:hypothetical protein